MHDAGARVIQLSKRIPLEVMEDVVDNRLARVRRGGMHDHSLRLIEYQQMGVFKNHIEGSRGGFQRKRGRRQLPATLDGVAGPDLGAALRDGFAVDPNPTFFDLVFEEGPRFLRQ